MLPYNTHHRVTCVVVCISREQAAACPTIHTTLFTKKRLIFVQQKKASVFELTVSIYAGLFPPGKLRALFTKRGLCTTGWPRPIGSLNSQLISRKRATNCRALLRKMTYEDKASYASWPSRSVYPATTGVRDLQYTPSFHQQEAEYSLFCRALLQKRPIFSRSLLLVATPCTLMKGVGFTFWRENGLCMSVYLEGTGSVPYNTHVSFHHNESLLETGMRALKYIQGSFHP